jgi:hypothetical protein
VLIVHGTKKFLDRVGQPNCPPESESTTALGSWYANVLFWKPQVALFVNTTTRLPVFVALAPASRVIDRFPEALKEVLEAIEVDRRFVDHELNEMSDHGLAKTNSRSVLGTLNDFFGIARHMKRLGHPTDPLSLSLQMAHSACGPLFDRTGFPDLEVRAIAEHFAG